MSYPVLFVPGGLASAFIQGGPLLRRPRRNPAPLYKIRYHTTAPAIFASKGGGSDQPNLPDGIDGFFSGLGNIFFGTGNQNNYESPARGAPLPKPNLQDVDLTTVEVPILSILPVSSAGNILQITVNVAATGLANSHVAPGQFVQIGLTTRARRARFRKLFLKFVTVATPPGASGDVFQFLVNTNKDDYKFDALQEGDKIRISPVMGRGLDYVPAASSSKLLIFVDNEQGLATAKSLVEFEHFRAASGNGAMRRTSTTIYYSVPCHKTMGYFSLFSDWLVFGVSVVPVLGLSLMEHLSTRNITGEGGHLRDHYAIFCVSTKETFEALMHHTILNGLKTKEMQSFTQATIAEDVLSFDNDDSWRPPPPKSRPDSFAREETERQRAEKDSWSRWVKIRNSMKEEFERKWRANAKFRRDLEQEQLEKEQAWASWFGRNYEKWDQAAWDNEHWAGYRNFWGQERDKWGGDSSWKNSAYQGASGSGSGSGSSSNYGEGGYGWQQQNSQEYWDWVGKGTGSKGSASSSSSSSNGWYDKYADSGGYWGSSSSHKSGYQERGYRYQYEEQDSYSSSSKNNNGPYQGSSSSRNYGQNSQKSYSHNSWRNDSQGGRQQWNSKQTKSTDLDLYEVLGLTTSASKSEIKRAYRKKAMQHHPDRNPDKSDLAHIKMKEIVAAYTVLKDDEKRKLYDKFGSSGF